MDTLIEVLNTGFAPVCTVVALVGLIGGAFVLTVMFDDKQRYPFDLKGFIKWLREAGTDYRP